jgi:hypothetical protein
VIEWFLDHVVARIAVEIMVVCALIWAVVYLWAGRD